MPIELAADAIDQVGLRELGLRHRRNNIYANRRILLLAAAAALVTIFVIVAAVDSSRTSSARRYANAVRWAATAGLRCDDALGKRRLWLGSVVEYKEMCVPHNISKSHVTKDAGDVLNFLIIGDWGRDGMCCQRDVAAEMSIAAVKVNPQFIVSVGDNFYDRGIDASTDKQVDRSWRDVYINPHKSLHNVTWKVILGNHDHAGNVAAQTVLGRDDALWHMPAKYYFETAEKGDVFMAFIDTTVMYYTQKELLDDYKGDTITMFYRDNQVAAIKKALSESTAKWKIVFGHHPFFSSAEHAIEEEHNRRQLRTILMHVFKENNVAVYFSGHEHTLEHHQSDGINFFVSGAGSKIGPIEFNSENSLFALDRQGFMVVSLDESQEHLTVQTVDMEGKIVYRVNITRPQA